MPFSTLSEPLLDRMIAPAKATILYVYTDGFKVYKYYDGRQNYLQITIVHAHTFGEVLRTTIKSFWGMLKALA